MGIYKDFIPAGEDTGAQSDNGFADFVTPKQEVEKPQEKIEEKPVKKETKK